MNKTKTLKLVLSIIIIISAFTGYEKVQGASTFKTLYIENESDDRYQIVDIGTVIDDVNVLKITSGTTEVRSALRFSGQVIPRQELINDANLSVFIPENGFFGGDSFTFTLYGHKHWQIPQYADLAPFGTPRTTAQINIDASTIGSGWVNISVTPIIQELVNQFYWNSPDTSAFSLGTSSLSGNGKELVVFPLEATINSRPRLYIEYGGEPTDNVTGLPDGAIYWKTEDGVDIYNFTDFDYEDFHNDYTKTNPSTYITTSASNPFRVDYIEYGFVTFWSTARNIRRDLNVNWTTTLESRFKWTQTSMDTISTHRPDFFVCTPKVGANEISFLHYVGATGQDDDPYGFQYADGVAVLPFSAYPSTAWYRILYNETSETTNYWVWEQSTAPSNWSEGSDYNGSSAETNPVPASCTAYFGLKSQLGENYYGGKHTGYIANLYILEDGAIPLADTIYYFAVNDTVVYNTTDVDLIDDIIEDIAGPDPEDPDPPSWADSWISRFQFKSILFWIFFLMGTLPLMWGAYIKPSGPDWIPLLFISFAGWAVLMGVVLI